MEAQLPFALPVSKLLHDTHVPVQVVRQQIPSTQLLFRHSESALQGSPSGVEPPVEPLLVLVEVPVVLPDEPVEPVVLPREPPVLPEELEMAPVVPVEPVVVPVEPAVLPVEPAVLLVLPEELVAPVLPVVPTLLVEPLLLVVAVELCPLVEVAPEVIPVVPLDDEVLWVELAEPVPLELLDALEVWLLAPEVEVWLLEPDVPEPGPALPHASTGVSSRAAIQDRGMLSSLLRHRNSPGEPQVGSLPAHPGISLSDLCVPLQVEGAGALKFHPVPLEAA
jgi:hypothetical protein